MVSLTLHLSDEILSASKGSPEEFGRELRLAAAAYWYSRGEMSEERAAQVAGLNRKEFLRALARGKVDTFLVDFDELEEELRRSSPRHER